MKIAFAIIQGLLVVASAYFSVDIMYQKILPDRFEIPSPNAQGRSEAGESKPDKGGRMIRGRYDTIIKRNLFNVDLEADKGKTGGPDPEAVPVEKLEPTELKLSLWGTVTGGDPVYAVIEDKKTREQSLYEVGDRVQEATVKRIMRHGVVLNYRGKDQILEMEDQTVSAPPPPFKGANSKSAPVPPVIGKVSQEEPESEELSSLMKEVKIRPHFSDGEPDGLMVYGIRPDSVFRQIGLRNGDVIKNINGTSIVSAEDALHLYSEIKESESAKVTLLRRGKEQEIEYQMKDGQYVVNSLSDENPESIRDEAGKENAGEKDANDADNKGEK